MKRRRDLDGGRGQAIGTTEGSMEIQHPVNVVAVALQVGPDGQGERGENLVGEGEFEKKLHQASRNRSLALSSS
ncbi:hypothetical protein D3C78_1626410 [compost metagenome]